MSFDSEIDGVFVRAWRAWTKEADDGQEQCARILTRYIDSARRHRGLTNKQLFTRFATNHPKVTFQQFKEMLAFLDDWEGVR